MIVSFGFGDTIPSSPSGLSVGTNYKSIGAEFPAENTLYKNTATWGDCNSH